MARVSMFFGAALIALSVVSFLIASQGTEAPSKTLFIPAGFGTVLFVCGIVAVNPVMRKHAMHAAAAVALIGGLVAGGRGASKLFSAPVEGASPNTLALISVWGMTILCFLFVFLCVRSFIEARKKREAEAKK